MKKHLLIITILLTGISCASLSTAQQETAVADTQTENAETDALLNPSAWAPIAATTEGSSVEGWVEFYASENGIKAVVSVSGVTPPGKHGIHIHENGSCDDNGKAAGSHFNPHTKDHGFLPKDGLEHSHAGDMGNIDIDANGEGSLEIVLPGLALEGENGIIGKSVILHEKEDDFGQPVGNAGGRIGCGIIEPEPESAEETED